MNESGNENYAPRPDIEGFGFALGFSHHFGTAASDVIDFVLAVGLLVVGGLTFQHINSDAHGRHAQELAVALL